MFFVLSVWGCNECNSHLAVNRVFYERYTLHLCFEGSFIRSAAVALRSASRHECILIFGVIGVRNFKKDRIFVLFFITPMFGEMCKARVIFG